MNHQQIPIPLITLTTMLIAQDFLMRKGFVIYVLKICKNKIGLNR